METSFLVTQWRVKSSSVLCEETQDTWQSDGSSKAAKGLAGNFSFFLYPDKERQVHGEHGDTSHSAAWLPL